MSFAMGFIADAASVVARIRASRAVRVQSLIRRFRVQDQV